MRLILKVTSKDSLGYGVAKFKSAKISFKLGLLVCLSVHLSCLIALQDGPDDGEETPKEEEIDEDAILAQVKMKCENEMIVKKECENDEVKTEQEEEMKELDETYMDGAGHGQLALQASTHQHYIWGCA